MPDDYNEDCEKIGCPVCRRHRASAAGAHGLAPAVRLRRRAMTSKLVACASLLLVACSSSPGGPDGSTDGQSDVVVDTGIDGTSDAPFSDGASDAGSCTLAMPPSNPTCATCLQSSCCATANACLGSSDCLAYVACVEACAPSDGGTSTGDGGLPEAATADSGEGSGFSCYVTCEKQHPNSVNDGTDFIACETTTCATDCP